MAVDPPRKLLPSFIDRLTDPNLSGIGSGTVIGTGDKKSSRVGATGSGYSEREMMNAVRRDLENLLNTRRSYVDVPPQCKEVSDSILTYGLPDLITYNGTSKDQCVELARQIMTVIARHEPRLRNVSVIVTSTATPDSRAIKFHIDAALNVDPAPKVGFETVLELMTGRATVKQDEGNG